MNYKYTSCAILFWMVLIGDPTSGIPQTTNYWVVVRESSNPNYLVQGGCVYSNRSAALEAAAALRALEGNDKIHAIPRTAFEAQQAAGVADPQHPAVCGG